MALRDEIRVLTFDVGGSVFDWQSATRAAVSELAAARGVELDDKAFCWTWRRRMFEMLAEVRKGTRERTNADGLHRIALDELGDDYPALQLTDADKDALTDVWHHMGVWPDVPDALVRLRRDYVVSILTVLSLSIVVDSSRHAGIDWDAYLSCEFLERYKPEPRAYLQACELFRAAPNQVLMVAVHPPDLAAAQAAGLRTAFVKPKVEEMGSRGDTAGFDIRAEDYTDLADQLCG